ncbi:MAG: hypothetical protein HY791_19155 [Deltaproteobacteria bacterium]|nr:hypothetical protein [Deltaproteobacteria bacterium]
MAEAASQESISTDLVLEVLRRLIAEKRPAALANGRLVVGVVSSSDGQTDWQTIRIERDGVTLDPRAPSLLDKAPRVTLVGREIDLSEITRGRPAPVDIFGDKRLLSLIARCFATTTDLLSLRAMK